MNSKVIKWFKRQASIRRLTEKSEDKEECAQNTEEKRKRSFPRLSFRRRNKKKTSSASDIEGNLAVVSISKRFSQSMPQEMESETRDLQNSNCGNNAVSLENASIMDSPTKTDGYRSVSELSYHSSFDYSRETNESLSLGEKQSIIAEIDEDKERDVSDISKPSTYDNQQTFHSVSSSFTSINKDQSKTPPCYNQTVNAPIVKMEEICDTVSEKEHPVEIENDNNSVSSRNTFSNYKINNSDIIRDDSDCILSAVKTKSVNADSIDLLNKGKENTENLNINMEPNNNHSENTHNIGPNTLDVFEEIDRLVKNASSLVDDEDDETCNDCFSKRDSKTSHEIETLHIKKGSDNLECGDKQNVLEEQLTGERQNGLEEHLTILKIVEPHESENVFKPCSSFGNLSTDECSKDVETCLENLGVDENLKLHDDEEIEINTLEYNEPLSKNITQGKKLKSVNEYVASEETINTPNLYPSLQTFISPIRPEPEFILSDTHAEPKISSAYVNPEPEVRVSFLNNGNENASQSVSSAVPNLSPKEQTCMSSSSQELEVVPSRANIDLEMNTDSVNTELEISATSLTQKQETNGSLSNQDIETTDQSYRNPKPETSVPYSNSERKASETYMTPELETNLSNNNEKPAKSELSRNAEAQPTNHMHSLNNRLDDVPPFEITISQHSPKKQESNVGLVHTSISNTSLGSYPKELNPFGDDSDSNDEKADGEREKRNISKVTRGKENGRNLKENGSNRFEVDTNINHVNTVMNPKERSCRPKYEFGNAGRPSEYSSTSLNPFGDYSDVEEDPASPLDANNPFKEEEEWNKSQENNYPPRLPPKSGEYHKRKTSGGSLVPIPHPRRSKQSHHGSYTSLQNVSTIPVPAPRSITPSGSSRTLNVTPLNPFEDDEDEGEDFNRQGLGRCSMQAAGSSYSVQEPFVRSDVRGSLPPSSRFRVRTKKRQAPLPPGVPHCKPPASPSDPKHFTSLPRRRTSTSPASHFQSFERRRSPATVRENSPHRVPPPRPPPPKI